MKNKKSQLPYHRTGKPYACSDVQIVLERTDGDIDALHLFEAGMIYLHFDRCPGNCKALFTAAFDIPRANEPQRQAQWLADSFRRLFISIK